LNENNVSHHRDRCLDGGQSFRGAWNLDEEVRFAPALVEIARGG
jgi:hypothetical protein